MHPLQSNDIAHRKALKKRRKPVINWITVIVAAPLFFAYFTVFREPTMIWLYDNGVLPDFGVMQFIEGTSPIDWDRVLVSGVVGALFAFIGSVVAIPIAWATVR